MTSKNPFYLGQKIIDQVYAPLNPEIKHLIFKPVHLTYRKKRKRFFQPMIKDQSVVFDIGAHHGELTSIFLSLGAKVICVEPQPSCLKYLEQKYQSTKRTCIVPKGVSYQKGQQTFYISLKNPATSTFSEKFQTGRYHHRHWEKEIKVEMTTLDQLIKEFGSPSFCKIDTEGYEWQVLSGLSQPIPYISFEFSQEFPQEIEKCLTKLSNLGYHHFNYSPFIKYKMISDKWLNSEEILHLMERNRKHTCGDIYASFDKPEK